MEPGSVSDAVVLVDVARRDDGAVDVEVVLADGAERTVVAAWEQRSGSTRVVVAERSPDRLGVAVLVGSELTQVDLEPRCRRTVATGVAWPESGEGVLVWGDDGPRVLVPGEPGATGLPLGGGRTLTVTAPVWFDHGLSGGDQGATGGVLLAEDASPADRRSALAELIAWRKQRARVTHHDRVAVAGPHESAVLLDELTTRTEGRTNVHWPVSVGRSGVIVRSSTTRVSGARSEETTIGEPWLVRGDGTVERIPVRLGNAPLCELPDGRWLLPGADELWCDAGNEPLHALGSDGTLTPWVPGSDVSSESLLRAVAPELLPAASSADPDDWPWATAARISEDGGDIVLLIADASWSLPWASGEPAVWAIVRLPADGRAAPRLIAAGRDTPERFTVVAL